MGGTNATLMGGKSLTLIGAGNTGLAMALHAARMPQVRRITCIEPGRAEESNCQFQDITPRDVGVPKALIAARRMREIRPELEVIPIIARVEDVPWGLLRSDVICGCVDNREARAQINTIAWRLGVPWVDAGIRAEGLLARVSVFVPGRGAPCLECAWGEKDYANLAERYSCAGVRREAPPTGAQTSLGALAAGMQAIECQKLLEGRMEQSLAGKQVIIEAAYHHHYVSVLRRRDDCRFDHESYGAVERVSADWTVGQLGALGGRPEGEPFALAVEGKNWVTQLRCTRCGREARVVRLQGRIGARALVCACGGRREAVGFGLQPRLPISAALRGRRLAALGLAAGDIVRIQGTQSERLVELVSE